TLCRSVRVCARSPAQKAILSCVQWRGWGRKGRARLKEDGLSGLTLAADGGMVLPLEGIDLTLVIVVMAVALLALAVAVLLVREFLAAQQGTERMRNIAVAVQEGAGAHVKRQFRSLVIFVVVTPLLLLLLPPDDLPITIGISVFFALGALLSAATGFIGMLRAVRGNIRVAAAASVGDDASIRTAIPIACRSGGVAGMVTV